MHIFKGIYRYLTAGLYVLHYEFHNRLVHGYAAARVGCLYALAVEKESTAFFGIVLGVPAHVQAVLIWVLIVGYAFALLRVKIGEVFYTPAYFKLTLRFVHLLSYARPQAYWRTSRECNDENFDLGAKIKVRLE